MKVPQAMVLTTAVSVTDSNGGAVDDHHVEEGLQLTQGLGHRGRAEQLAGVGRSRTRADKGDVRRVRHLNFYESRDNLRGPRRRRALQALGTFGGGPTIEGSGCAKSLGQIGHGHGRCTGLRAV